MTTPLSASHPHIWVEVFEGFGSMEPSGFGGIEEHLQEQEECTRTLLWFGASSSCLAFMESVAPQDGLTKHSSYIYPRPPCHQLQARQQHNVTTTLPPPFDLREAIRLGYQNTVELVSEASEEGCVDASHFLEMLNMANQHVIKIPPRTVLMKIMETICAKTEPVFTCTPCGGLHFKVCIELDVSGATYPFGKPRPIAKVEGEICPSPALAETNAIKKAFKYLGQAHFIQVCDYSSSIIQMFHRFGYDWGDVDEIDYLLKKLIEQWDLSLKQCNELSDKLDYKVIMDDNHDDAITEASKVYTTLDDFVIYIIKRYEGVPDYARSELEKIQDERLKYNENLTKKQNKFIMQEQYLQTVWFSEKDVLDYVLSYLGVGKAEYNSVPRDNGQVEAEVKFSFPCMVEGRCHILIVNSRALASSRAKEIAARAALLFMESKFNVRIVDLNYAGREIAEEEHKSMEFMIYRLLEVADQIKTQLSNMVECIGGGRAVCRGDTRSIFGGPLCQEQIMAVEFCSKNVEVVWADCARRTESAASIFQEMENLSYKFD